MDIDEKASIHTTSEMIIIVDNVNSNGQIAFTWTLNHVAITVDGKIPGIEGKIDYDSRRSKPGDSRISSLFSRIANKPIKVVVDKSGKVVGFNLPGQSTVVNPDDPLASLVRGFASPQAFEQLPMFITSGAPVPAKVRSKWSRKTSLEMPSGVGSLVTDQNFNFSRIRPRQKLAFIKFDGLITKTDAPSSTASPPSLALIGADLKVNKGTIKGELLWDFVTGQLDSAESEVTLETSLSSLLGQMELTQNMVSTVKRVQEHKREKTR